MRRALTLSLLLLAGCTRRDGDAAVDASVADASAPAPSSTGAAAANATTTANALPAPALAPSARAAAMPAVPSSAWEWKTYRGDQFSALFPGDPKITVLPAEDDKIGYTEALLDMPGSQVSFVVGFSEHTKEDVAKPEAFLDKTVDAPRRGLTDVLHNRSVTLSGGHPGRVLILRRNISGTPLRVYSRLHLVGLRLYSLIVSTLDVGGVSEDVVKKFMESFKVL